VLWISQNRSNEFVKFQKIDRINFKLFGRLLNKFCILFLCWLLIGNLCPVFVYASLKYFAKYTNCLIESVIRAYRCTAAVGLAFRLMDWRQHAKYWKRISIEQCLQTLNLLRHRKLWSMYICDEILLGFVTSVNTLHNNITPCLGRYDISCHDRVASSLGMIYLQFVCVLIWRNVAMLLACKQQNLVPLRPCVCSLFYAQKYNAFEDHE